jgi:hypothetical protein
MATKRKSAKQGSKRKAATRKAATKSARRKAASRRPAGRKSSSAKSTVRKTVAKPKRRKTRMARAGEVAEAVKQKTLQGVDIVVDTGERAWDALKSTTSNVVESVRGRIGGETPIETELRPE